MGSVNVIDIKPKDYTNNGKVIVYTHGGGYVLYSANSTLIGPVIAANTTGLRVISIDYTLAPFSKWDKTTDEIISVIDELIKKHGYDLNYIAMYGDSAGGAITLASVLKMRDKGMGIPAALVVMSPNTDLTLQGDTYFTLNGSDPLLSDYEMLKHAADAYAEPSDRMNPYVSAVYGNFTKGFPPTLIQVGTKEVVLSDSIRLYQALDQVNIPVKLAVYEGMPHVFQNQLLLYDIPESKISYSKMNDFFKQFLKY